MMTYIVSQRTRCIGAVAVHASLHAICSSALTICNSIPTIYSGAIEQILDSSATHRFQGAAYDSLQKIYISIIPQSPVTTQDNRGLFAGISDRFRGAA